MRGRRIEVYLGKGNAGWCWRLRAGNNRIMGSGAGFNNYGLARRSAIKACGNLPVVRK